MIQLSMIFNTLTRVQKAIHIHKLDANVFVLVCVIQYNIETTKTCHLYSIVLGTD